MPALARTTVINCDTRAANEDCINGGSRTRTKYTYDSISGLISVLSTINGGTPGAGNISVGNGSAHLTDEQWAQAVDYLDQGDDAAAQAAVDRAAANMNPTPQNWEKYNEDQALAQRFYDRYNNLVYPQGP